jgi:hypothetical protein
MTIDEYERLPLEEKEQDANSLIENVLNPRPGRL